MTDERNQGHEMNDSELDAVQGGVTITNNHFGAPIISGVGLGLQTAEPAANLFDTYLPLSGLKMTESSG